MKKITEKELEFIYGNEHLKRAIEVAQEANQSLLIIGGDKTQASEIALKLNSPNNPDNPVSIYNWSPCPCGNSRDTEIECTCSFTDIKKHLLKKPVCDMEIEIAKPHFHKIKDKLKKEYKLDKTSLELLKTAYKTASLSPKEVITIIKRAEAIQKLDNITASKTIQPAHVAESLQYRLKD